jgi:predicted PurR-regulated permease PerM
VDAVEWLELGVLLVLVLFMAGVFRLLWEYTKAIQRQNSAINAQDDRLQKHRENLESYEQEVAQSLDFLNGEHRRLMGKTQDNAAHLEEIRTAMGSLVPTLDLIRTVLDNDPGPGPDPDNPPGTR